MVTPPRSKDAEVPSKHKSGEDPGRSGGGEDPRPPAAARPAPRGGGGGQARRGRTETGHLADRQPDETPEETAATEQPPINNGLGQAGVRGGGRPGVASPSQPGLPPLVQTPEAGTQPQHSTQQPYTRPPQSTSGRQTGHQQPPLQDTDRGGATKPIPQYPPGHPSATVQDVRPREKKQAPKFPSPRAAMKSANSPRGAHPKRAAPYRNPGGVPVITA